MSNQNIPIVVENITIRFDGREAISDLNLEFEKGKFTAVIGKSGSGKSLLLKCAAGLIYPDDGQVFFEGELVKSMGEKQYGEMQARTGFHFQDAALWSNKTLAENLSLPLLSVDPGITDSSLRDKVAESFSSVGLNVNPSLRPSAISMGQQKMVSFLRAVITQPEFLFLDDPLSFLDHAGSRRMIARIQELKEDGTTIIIATHDRDLTGRMADRVIVLVDGNLTASGPYHEVMSSQDPVLLPLLQELV